MSLASTRQSHTLENIFYIYLFIVLWKPVFYVSGMPDRFILYFPSWQEYCIFFFYNINFWLYALLPSPFLRAQLYEIVRCVLVLLVTSDMTATQKTRKQAQVCMHIYGGMYAGTRPNKHCQVLGKGREEATVGAYSIFQGHIWVISRSFIDHFEKRPFIKPSRKFEEEGRYPRVPWAAWSVFMHLSAPDEH